MLGTSGASEGTRAARAHRLASRSAAGDRLVPLADKLAGRYEVKNTPAGEAVRTKLLSMLQICSFEACVQIERASTKSNVVPKTVKSNSSAEENVGLA